MKSILTPAITIFAANDGKFERTPDTACTVIHRV